MVPSDTTDPVWRVTYRYRGEEDEQGRSCESFLTAAEAEERVRQMAAEPELFSKMRISWPHLLSDPPEGDGWIAVEDLSSELRQELELIIAPTPGKPQ